MMTALEIMAAPGGFLFTAFIFLLFKGKSTALVPTIDPSERLPTDFPPLRYSKAGSLLDTTEQAVWWGYAKVLEPYARNLFQWMANTCPPDPTKKVVGAWTGNIATHYGVPGPSLATTYTRSVTPVAAPVSAVCATTSMLVDLNRETNGRLEDRIRRAAASSKIVQDKVRREKAMLTFNDQTRQLLEKSWGHQYAKKMNTISPLFPSSSRKI